MEKVRWTNSSRESKLSLYLLIMIFAVMLAYRPDDFHDTISYKMIYDQIDIHHKYGFDLFGEILTIEYGFFYFLKLCKTIGLSFGICFSFYNSLTLSLIIYAVGELVKYNVGEDYKVNYYQILLVYMSFFGIYYLGIAVRVSLCFALMFLMMENFEKKRYPLCALYFLIGFTVHRMMLIALVVLLIYWLGNIQFKNKVYIIIWVLSGAYILFNTSTTLQNKVAIMLTKYLLFFNMGGFRAYVEDYFNGDFRFSWVNFVVWVYIGFLTFLIFNTSMNRRLLNILYVGLVISILLYTLQGSSRIYDFFTVFSVVVIMAAVPLIKDNNKGILRLISSIGLLAVEVVGMALNYYIIYMAR